MSHPHVVHPPDRAPLRRSVRVAAALAVLAVVAGGGAWQAFAYLGSVQGAIDAAVLGTLVVAGGLIWRRLSVRLGSATALAAISGGVAVLTAALAATVPLCHGTALATNAAGACPAAGVAQWTLTAAVLPWVVAFPIAAGAAFAKLFRKLWRLAAAKLVIVSQADTAARGRLGPSWERIQRWARTAPAVEEDGPSHRAA